jgi:hypothetical protein
MPTYETLLRFRRDFAQLSPNDREGFKQAAARFVDDLGQGRAFRPGLRVRGIQGAPGIFEMTWAPNGRATFNYGEPVREGQVHVVWRRVGTHDVFTNP